MADNAEPNLPDRAPVWQVIVLAGVELVPGVGGAMARLLEATLEADRRRVAQVGNAAREATGDDGLLVRRLEQDERLRDMLLEAVEAGARSSHEPKRVAMGRVLAQAVNDDAQLDDSAALVHALAELDSPHFAIMAKLENRRRNLRKGIRPQPEIEVPEPYRSALLGQGVVWSRDSDDSEPGLLTEVRPPPLAISDFGSQLLGWIREAADAVGSSTG